LRSSDSSSSSSSSSSIMMELNNNIIDGVTRVSMKLISVFKNFFTLEFHRWKVNGTTKEPVFFRINSRKRVSSRKQDPKAS
jgi:hypothetical protein